MRGQHAQDGGRAVLGVIARRDIHQPQIGGRRRQSRRRMGQAEFGADQRMGVDAVVVA